MAYPIVKGTATYSNGVGMTNQIVDFSTFTVGDLLICMLSSNGTYTYVGNGWSTSVRSSSTSKAYLFYKIADGDDVLTLTGAGASYISSTISGARGIQFNSNATGEPNDVKSLYLDTGKVKEYLWMVFETSRYDWATAAPTGYSGYQRVGNQWYTSIGYKNAETSDNAESIWPMSGNTTVWTAWTLAIIPLPIKITIGVQNNNKAIINGDITKNNLIIKE